MRHKQIAVFFSRKTIVNNPIYALLNALQAKTRLPVVIRKYAENSLAHLKKNLTEQNFLPVELLQKLAVLSGTESSIQPKQSEVMSAFHYYLTTLIHVIDFQMSQLEPNNIDRSIDALSQMITIGEIQELSINHFNQISIQIFDKPLLDVGQSNTLEPLRALLKNLEDARLQKIEIGLTQFLLGCLNHYDPDAIFNGFQNLPLFISASSDQTLQIIDVFYFAFFPLNASVDYETKWIHVVSALSNRSVSPNVLDVLLPKSYPADFIKTTFETFNAPKELKDGLLALNALIQKRLMSTEGKDQKRWNHANNRIMEIVDIVYTSSISQPLSKEIAERVTDACHRQIKVWEGTCSVGIEMGALDFRQKIESILSKNDTNANLETNHNALIPAIQIKLQTCLKSILPIYYSTDVHHINLLMALIYAQLGEQTVPDSLKDPYLAAFRDKMYEKKEWLLQKFNESDWLFEAIVYQLQMRKQTAASIQTVLDEWGQLFVPKTNPQMDGEIYGRLLESTMRYLPHLFLDHIVSMDDIHTQLGGHGILGLSARAGNFEIFIKARQSISKAKMEPVDHIDSMGYQLWDYVVWGGNPELLRLIINENTTTFGNVLNKVPNEITPTLLALAAESKSIKMLRTIIEYCSSEQFSRMLVGQDQRGFTPVMHAAATGDPEIIEEILLKLSPQNTPFNQMILESRNNDGQTPLILASSFAYSTMAIQVLLRYGANPNARVMGVDGENGYSPIEIAMIESRSDIVKTLCASPDIEVNLLTLFRLTTHKECVQICAQKAYELGHDILALLRERETDTHQFVHWLAQYNGAVLESLIKSDVLQDKAIGILKLPDAKGNSVAHWLAQYNGAVLESLIKSDVLQDHELEILKYNNTNRNCVAHWLARYNGAVLESLIKSDVLQDKAIEILKLSTAKGDSVAHCLAKHNGVVLESLIKSDVLQDHELEILKLPAANGSSVALWLAECNVLVFQSLIKSDLLQGNAMEILKLSNNSGNSVAHFLAEYNDPVFQSLIKSDLLQGNALNVLKIMNKDGVSIGIWLAKHKAAVLESLMKSDRLQSDALAILKIQHGKYIDCVVHFLRRYSEDTFRALFKRDWLQGQTLEILKIGDMHNYSVASLLAIHEKDFLASLLLSEDNILEILKMKKDEAAGNCIAYYLYNYGRNNAGFVSLLRSDGLRGHGLEVLKLYPWLFSTSDDLLRMIKLTTSDGLSIVHRAAIDDSPLLNELLEISDLSRAISILEITDLNNTSVAHLMAQHNQDVINSDVLDHLSLNDPNSHGVSYWADVQCSRAFVKVLRCLPPDKAFDLLTLRDSQRVTVAHCLAQYNPKLFQQLLNMDHLRPQADRILKLKNSQGVSVEQLFSEAIAHDSAIQFNTQCTVS